MLRKLLRQSLDFYPTHKPNCHRCRCKDDNCYSDRCDCGFDKWKEEVKQALSAEPTVEQARR